MTRMLSGTMPGRVASVLRRGTDRASVSGEEWDSPPLTFAIDGAGTMPPSRRAAEPPAMSPSAWRHRLRLPSYRPDLSRSGGALRRGLLLASLACLSFLTVLAGTAAAQDVTFSSDAYSVNEGDAATPELVLSHSRSEAVTVHVQALGFGRARGGEDFAAGPWDVTVPAGRTRQSFSIATFDDDEVEGNEQFLLHIAPYGHSDGVRRSTSGTPDAVVTITGKTKISVPDARFRIQEGGTVTIGLTIGTPARPTAFTLDYTLSGTTASGADVVGGFGARSITVPANARRVDIPIGTVKDTVNNEGVEWFQVRLSTTASGVVFDATDIDVGIDDADPEVSFVAASSVTNEQSHTHNVALKLMSEPASAITLGYTVGGTATAGSDYTALSGTVTVPAGKTTATIPVAIRDDSAPEGEETVALTLAGGNGYQVASPDTHTLTIAISDAPRVPTVHLVSDRSWVNEDVGTHHLQLGLSSSLPFDLTVNYAVVNHSVTSGSDYEPLSGRATVPAGATTAAIPVTIIDDNDQEGTEKVGLELTTGAGYRLRRDNGHRHLVTIRDNDRLPVVSFASSTTQLNEGVGTHNVTSNSRWRAWPVREGLGRCGVVARLDAGRAWPSHGVVRCLGGGYVVP